MKKLLLGFLILVSSASYAVDPIDFATATPAEVRAYNLKLTQQTTERWNNEFAKVERDLQNVKSSVNGPNIKQTLERSGVLSDGSKVNVKAVVTQPVDKAKVATTLTERLKNAKDYAKNLGKASIPSFVGMAAFQGLMEGIDWVMGEGGQVTKPPVIEKTPIYDPTDKHISPYEYRIKNNDGSYVVAYSMNAVCPMHVSYHNSWQNIYTYTYTRYSGLNCYATSIHRQDGGKTPEQVSAIATRTNNPYYQTPPDNTPVPVSDSELQTALKNALESNNPALAAAIAGAITAAYTYDKSEGQNDAANRPVIDAAQDMSDALPKAFDNPVPTSDPERPSGYAKITDGEKTIESYVTPAPISGTTDTTTTPVIDPVTGQPTGETSTSGGFQFPKFCDWAAVVCDWIEWTKEPPEEEEELEVPVSEIDKQDIKEDLITVAASACPPDQRFDVSGLPFGISINKSYSMQPICNTLEPLKYVFQLMTFCLCAFMLLRI